MRQYVILVSGLVGLTAAVSLSAGCASLASSPAPTHSAGRASERATLSSDPWRGEAGQLASAMWQLTTTGIAWRYEPKGRTAGAAGTGSILCAHIARISKDGSQLSFDAEQLFVGEVAIREARRDGQDIPGLLYARNQYRHVQKAPVAQDCVFVRQTAGLVEPYPGANPEAVGMVALTPQQFAKSYRIQGFPPTLPVFWLVIENGEVLVAVEEYLD